MKKYRLPVLLGLGLSLTSLSAFAEPCTDLQGCAKLMFEFKGQRYIWDEKMSEFKFVSSPNVELTKDNADLMFTALLDQVGLARLPVGDGSTYRVVKSVKLKEIETPIIEASAELPPAFPSETWDWVTMNYKVKDPLSVDLIEKTYRLHLPREARIQGDENAGLVIVTGTIPVVRQMYETIKAADKPLSASARENNRQWRSSMMHARERLVSPVTKALEKANN